MPKIETFDNPISGLRPDNGMEQVAAMNARHVDQEYQRAGAAIGGGIAAAGDAYTRVKTQQEISQGLATSAEIRNNLETAWSATINGADPNDHSVAEKFQEEQIKPILDAWTTSFNTESGQKWAEAEAAQIRNHMFSKTAADQSTQAGVAAVKNYTDFVNYTRNTVFNSPSDLPVAMQTTEAAIDAMVTHNPYLNPETAARMKGELLQQAQREVATSAIEGAARSNPDALLKELATGKFQGMDAAALPIDLNKATTLALEYKRSQLMDQERNLTMAKQQEKDAANAAMTSLYAEGIGKGPNGTWAPPPNYNQRLTDIVQQHPTGVSMSEVHAASNMVATFTEDQASGRLVTSNPATYADFERRLTIAPGQAGALTKAEIYQAAADRKLSNHDATILTDAVEKVGSDPSEKLLQQTMQSFFTGQKGFVLGTTGMPSSRAQQRYYEFQTAVRNAVGYEKSQGKTANDIINDLFQPNGRNYIGRPNSPWMQYYHTGQHPERGGVVLSLIPGHPDNPAAQPGAAKPSLDDLARVNGLS